MLSGVLVVNTANVRSTQRVTRWLRPFEGLFIYLFSIYFHSEHGLVVVFPSSLHLGCAMGRSAVILESKGRKSPKPPVVLRVLAIHQPGVTATADHVLGSQNLQEISLCYMENKAVYGENNHKCSLFVQENQFVGQLTK